MISPTLKMAGALLGAGGVIVGGATGVYYLTNNKAKEENKVTSPAKQKISALLASDNLALLDQNGDEEAWPKAWEEFTKAYKEKEPDGAWKIESWTTKKDQTKGLPDLKKLCKSNAEEEVAVNNKGKLYEEVSKYCTKSTKPSPTPQ